MTLWQQIVALPPGVATFMGTLAGSSLGLLAILLGALFNAHLNRARDDRLRAEEARSIRGALLGELIGIRDGFNNMASTLEKKASDTNDSEDSFLVPDISASVRVMPPLLPKFGLLSPEVVRQVIDIYVVIEQFRPTLLLVKGTFDPDSHSKRGHHVQMPNKRAGVVSEIARNAAKRIDAVIETLRAN